MVHRFFPTCHVLKTWFELSRVKLYRNNQKGNKNYFDLAGGSSYRGFKLQRIKFRENPREINFGLSLHKVRISEGLSYWESAVYMYSPHYSPYICSGVPRNILPHPIKGLRKIPKRRGVLKESMVLKRNF